jgi:CheY-like chemotaxis protein
MSGEKATILLVDDNYQIRMPIRAYFERRGYTVIEAADGLEAVTQAVAHQPDIILLDVMMPVVDGREALKRLKKDDATKNIPVLMLTAVNDKNVVFSSLAGGAGDYVIKGSIGISDICQRVERLLEKHKTETALIAAASSAERVLSDQELSAAVKELCNPAAMPGRIKDVVALVNRPNCTLQDWMKLFETNRSLAETVCLLAGLPAAEEGQRPEQALAAVGASRLRSLALGAATLAAFSSFSGRLPERHLMGTALMTRGISLETQAASAEEAVTAGILHDFGKALLNNRFPLQYRAVLDRAEKEHRPLCVLERAMLGTDHAAFAAEIMAAWGMPPEFTEVVRLHHAPYKEVLEKAAFNPALIAAVELADALDRVWEPTDAGDDCIPVYAEEAAQALNVSQKSLNAALERALAQLDKAGDDRGKHSKAPEWAKGVAWKKVLVAHGPGTGVLLLETFFQRCSILVENASFDAAQGKAAGCDGALLRLACDSEIEPAANLCRKIRETDKTMPICLLADPSVNVTEQFVGVTVLRYPLSLAEILKVVRQARTPEPAPAAAEVAKS